MVSRGRAPPGAGPAGDRPYVMQRARPYRLGLLLLAMSWLACAAACSGPRGQAASDSRDSATNNQREYERHIRNLSVGTPPQKVRVSRDSLAAAGTDAYPTLIAHFDDRTGAADSLWGATLRRPTVGTACFEIIQDQIEGAWPKGFRRFHVLAPDNTRQWLSEHSGLTLDELRLAACRESIARAESARAANPASDLLQNCIRFLRERETELRE
jgi:hypothetical protein